MTFPIHFTNRRDAGRKLVDRLVAYRGDDVAVLAPPGSIPVAYEVAHAFDAPLDVIVTQKLGAPAQPDLGIGVIAQGDVLVLNVSLIQTLGLADSDIARVAHQARTVLERRLRVLHGNGRSDAVPPDVRGRTTFLVDDGHAGNVTATAMIRALRRRSPKRIVLATPASTRETITLLNDKVDAFVSLYTLPRYRGLGSLYRDYRRMTDEEIARLLADYQERRGDSGRRVLNHDQSSNGELGQNKQNRGEL